MQLLSASGNDFVSLWGVEKSAPLLYNEVEVLGMENQPLATELIRELRASNRRWFIIAIIELVIIIAVVLGFLWYISLPIDEISVEADGGNANYIGHDLEGELYNGESNTETQSDS